MVFVNTSLGLEKNNAFGVGLREASETAHSQLPRACWMDNYSQLLLFGFAVTFVSINIVQKT